MDYFHKWGYFSEIEIFWGLLDVTSVTGWHMLLKFSKSQQTKTIETKKMIIAKNWTQALPLLQNMCLTL